MKVYHYAILVIFQPKIWKGVCINHRITRFEVIVFNSVDQKIQY